MRLLTLLLLISLSSFAKDREWQIGTVTDSASDRRSAVAGSQTTGSVSSDGSVNATTRPKEKTWDEYVYVIDAGDRLLMIGESVNRVGNSLFSVAVGRPSLLIPGSKVQYALDKTNLIVRDDDRKEHKYRILRVSMKEHR